MNRITEAISCGPSADTLEARCEGIHIRSGGHAGDDARERQHDHHQIAAPGMHAAAVLSYRNARGEPRQAHVSDRHVAVIPAGHAHKAEWTAQAQRTTIMISPAFLQALARSNDLRDYQMTAQYASVDPFMWHMVRSIEQQLRKRRALEKSYVESVAVVIGQHLLCSYAQSASAPSPSGGLPHYKVRRAIDFIRAHYHEEIGFRDIAGQLGMSPYHFARMFRQSTNESPHQFIMRCRIEAAKKMLIEGERSIADIAFDVGYKSQSYFTTRFALLTGMTPAAFRGSR